MKPESLDPSVPSGRFNTELWAVTIEELEKKWFREGTLDYVSANTNRRLIPEGLFNILPEKTKDRIQRSSDARAERELQNPPRSDYSGAIQSGTEAATAPGQPVVPQWRELADQGLVGPSWMREEALLRLKEANLAPTR